MKKRKWCKTKCHRHKYVLRLSFALTWNLYTENTSTTHYSWSKTYSRKQMKIYGKLFHRWNLKFVLPSLYRCTVWHISRALVFWFGTLSPALRSFLLYFMSFSYHFNTLVVVLVCPCRCCKIVELNSEFLNRRENKTKKKTNRNCLGTNECEYFSSSSSSLSHRQMYSVTLYYISGESSK